MRKRTMKIVGTLTLDADSYPQDDIEAEEWLLDCVLAKETLELWSNEVGDSIGGFTIYTITEVENETV